jgi:AcrR family transcriptional regulator
MAERTRTDGQKRREELLDAALHCFTQRGVLATGVEEIRKQAGASPSSVYHHFDGLRGITVALLLRTFERAARHMAKPVLAATTAEAAARALVESYLEWALEHREEARFMYQAMAVELGEDRDPLLQAKANLTRPIFDHLNTFAQTGDLPDWPPTVLAVVLLGPTHDACRRLLSGKNLDTRWMRDTLPDLAWRAVKPR